MESRIQWTDDRQFQLLSELSGYFQLNEWTFGDYPYSYKPRSIHISPKKKIVFNCKSPTVNDELKYACWQKLKLGEWAPTTFWSRSRTLSDICDCINTVSPQHSLLEIGIEQWKIYFRTLLISRGRYHLKTNKFLNKNNEIQECQVEPAAMGVLSQIYFLLEDVYDTRDEWDKEIWDARRLGLKKDHSRTDNIINFTGIKQEWAFPGVKNFIRFYVTNRAWKEGQKKLGYVKNFLLFLEVKHPDILPHQLNREIVLEYFAEYGTSGVKSSSIVANIYAIEGFLLLSVRHGWIDFPDRQLIFKEDHAKLEESLPRDIPDVVMAQLNQHLHELPDHMRRMILVLQEGGMRIGELCNIPFTCLLQDHEGDYFLKYYLFKMKKEHTIPISHELAEEVMTQHKFVVNLFGLNCPYLFPNPDRERPHPILQRYVNTTLNELSYKHQIKDKSGRVWRFQSHQFRHSVGTSMINQGVPLVIVMRHLGHETPEMTLRYSRVTDQTMKKKFQEYKAKMVNAQGLPVSIESVAQELKAGLDITNEVSDDMEWLKYNIRAQGLPNGLCTLPLIETACPYGANKCIKGPDDQGCRHFKTDIRYLQQHKSHLERVNMLVAWAQQNPDKTRAAEILKENLPIQQNLIRIIAGIEKELNNDGQD